MSDIAIRVENLSKQYKLGATIRHDRLTDLLTHSLTSLFSRNSKSAIPNSTSEYIWALKDISFEVKEGETLGIIGPNGAGKSTLLKILSRITEPSMGRAEIYGRVGSLLEVGTGFDRELTGRENIYLSGSVLGMSKREINHRFDEIVEFSGVEKFIDTPVKRYSSGMYVRLAFAVAAHLQSEILIVDEVLAVGDAVFQKKCLGKMGDVTKQGRAVLFVSHNMSAILRLCPRAIFIDKGQIVLHAPSPAAVDRYLNLGTQDQGEKVWRAEELPETCGPFRPIAMRVCNGSGAVTNLVSSSQAFVIEIEYRLTEPMRDFRVGIFLYTNREELLFMSFDRDDLVHHERHLLRSPGHYISRCYIPRNWLNAGSLFIGVSASAPHVCHYFWDPHVLSLTVDVTGGVATQWQETRGGFFRPALEWDIEWHRMDS